jgi:anthranilate phosphoribosyltransferase
MIKEAISLLVEGKSLTMEQASEAMEEMTSGQVTPAQFGAFVTALRIKGETADEIAGLASVMRAKSVRVQISEPVIDIVGTGGDNSRSFNISTAAAFVAAGAGVRVAKHNNRAMTSRCGSADVLEALGVKIELNAAQVKDCLEKVGIGFMFAPLFHPAMKHAAGPRREIGIRTVFNILGPLTNPAGADHQVIGVPDENLGHKIAAVLHRLGTKHSLVVHSRDGLDELSISSSSLVWEVTGQGVLPPYEVEPQDFGFQKSSLADIRGGTPEENAAILRRILGGEEKGPGWEVVVMNAAAALLAGDQAKDLNEGARLAEKVIDSGQATEKLESLVKLSRSLV